jgi:thiol-disulfide isomerase/thioredoxin
VNFQAAPEFRGTSNLAIVTAFACMLGIAFGAVSSLHAAATTAELQRWTEGPQPTFTLPDTRGADVALESGRGHTVLVHFFATWCEPCREELPALNRLSARANGKLKVIAISVAEVDLRVRRFIETTPVNFPVLLDRERAVAKSWKVSSLPTTFILDADLRPRLVVESDFAWDTVDPAKLTGNFDINTRKQSATTNKTTIKPN